MSSCSTNDISDESSVLISLIITRIQFDITDGFTYSNSFSAATQIVFDGSTVTPTTASNSAPTADNSTVELNEDTTFTFALRDFGITDSDSDRIQEVEITSLETVGDLKYNGSAVTLNQVITAADIEAGKLTFDPVAEANGAAYDSFQFKVDDGTTQSASAATMTIDVDAVNDAPTNTVPGAQNVAEEGTLVFSTGNSNLISVSDSDDGGGVIKVTLTVNDGKLTLAQTTGLAFAIGDGTSDALMIFTGTASDINSALDGMSYAPNANLDTSDTLQITTDDRGNTGGAAQTDTDSVTINITASQDAPTAADSTVRTAPNVDHVFAASDFSFSDPDTADSLPTKNSPTLLIQRRHRSQPLFLLMSGLFMSRASSRFLQ